MHGTKKQRRDSYLQHFKIQSSLLSPHFTRASSSSTLSPLSSSPLIHSSTSGYKFTCSTNLCHHRLLRTPLIGLTSRTLRLTLRICFALRLLFVFCFSFDYLVAFLNFISCIRLSRRVNFFYRTSIPIDHDVIPTTGNFSTTQDAVLYGIAQNNSQVAVHQCGM